MYGGTTTGYFVARLACADDSCTSALVTWPAAEQPAPATLESTRSWIRIQLLPCGYWN